MRDGRHGAERAGRGPVRRHALSAEPGRAPRHRGEPAECRGCPLHADAAGTVFGRGDAGARLTLVDEQPGDQEDREGVPFAGSAGRPLFRAPAEAGIDEGDLYVTDAVEHVEFTREETGERRIHKAPNLRETLACRPRLLAEPRLVSPESIVTLGATAGRALLGCSFRVDTDRGVPRPLPGAGDGIRVLATAHPSAVLRARRREEREEVYAGLVAGLRTAAEAR